MSFLKNIFKLCSIAFFSVRPESWIVGILCGALAAMGIYRKRLRRSCIGVLNFLAETGNGYLELKIKIGHRLCRLEMRSHNTADYLIGGEMLWGAYNPPQHKPILIVDGGANIGMFSVIAHGYFPGVPIVCYEPDEANIRQLKRNLEANGICAKIVPKALWSRETTLYYHSGESYTGYVDEFPPGEPIECAIADVQNGCWLKLDIEGAEYEVLPEILSRGIRPAFISMEIHFNDQKGGGLMELLLRSEYLPRKPLDCRATCTNVELDFIG